MKKRCPFPFFFKEQKSSSFILILIAVITVAINFYEKPWKYPNNVIANDVISYYSYLPAAVIHKDVSFGFIKDDLEFYSQRFWVIDTPTGKRIPRTTMGLSFLYAPFFFLAHLSAGWLGYETDGFSAPYKFFLEFSSLFYVLIGLFFIRKILLKYFPDRIISWVIVIIFFGTNLLYYTTNEAAMAHAYLFALITVFFHLVIRWHAHPSKMTTFWIGLSAGLISHIRPTDIIVLLIFFFWGITNLETAKDKIRLLMRSYSHLLIMAGAFLLFWIPQLIYWKWATGAWFYYTYANNDEGFFFGHPQVIAQLFSYRKGWLLYTPVMILSLIGIPFLAFRLKKAFIPLLLYIAAGIYIMSSWWCWWYGGGYGQRPYIDSYGILALPMGFVIIELFQKRVFIRIITGTLLILLIGLNVFQTWQYSKGILHYYGTSRDLYWSSFLRTHFADGYNEKLRRPHYALAKKGIYVSNPVRPEEIDPANCTDIYYQIIRADTTWMKDIKTKALKNQLSLDEMIRREAGWMCEQRFNQKN